MIILSLKGKIDLSSRNSSPTKDVRAGWPIPSGKGFGYKGDEGEGFIGLGSVITAVSSVAPYLFFEDFQGEGEDVFIASPSGVAPGDLPRYFRSLEVNQLIIEAEENAVPFRDLVSDALGEKEEVFRNLKWGRESIYDFDLTFDSGELPGEEPYQVYGGDPELGVVFD